MTGVAKFVHSMWLLGLAVLFVGEGNVGLAQSSNPNPLLPSGVGSASDVDMSRGNQSSGGRLGRGVRADGRLDENPADTLLKGINGSNYGRQTGRNTFDPRRRSAAYRGVAPKIEEGAVRFDKRGSYEEAIYGTRAGSYSSARTTRRRNGR